MQHLQVVGDGQAEWLRRWRRENFYGGAGRARTGVAVSKKVRCENFCRGGCTRRGVTFKKNGRWRR
jgi:hypothetical protein